MDAYDTKRHSFTPTGTVRRVHRASYRPDIRRERTASRRSYDSTPYKRKAGRVRGERKPLEGFTVRLLVCAFILLLLLGFRVLNPELSSELAAKATDLISSGKTPAELWNGITDSIGLFGEQDGGDSSVPDADSQSAPIEPDSYIYLPDSVAESENRIDEDLLREILEWDDPYIK